MNRNIITTSQCMIKCLLVTFRARHEVCKLYKRGWDEWRISLVTIRTRIGKFNNISNFDKWQLLMSGAGNLQRRSWSAVCVLLSWVFMKIGWRTVKIYNTVLSITSGLVSSPRAMASSSRIIVLATMAETYHSDLSSLIVNSRWSLGHQIHLIWTRWNSSGKSNPLSKTTGT